MASTQRIEEENTSNLEDWTNFDELYIVVICFTIYYIDKMFYLSKHLAVDTVGWQSTVHAKTISHKAWILSTHLGHIHPS